MRKDDKQLGAPFVNYKDTEANIEALSGIVEGAQAYATDTDKLGTFDGTNWVWGSAGGASAFTDLTDAFAAYTGLGGQYVKVKATEDGLETGSPAGAGDMTKAEYDTDNDGTVDAAESVPWAGVTGAPSIPSDLDDLSDVYTTGAADGNVLAFDDADNTWKPAAAGAGGGDSTFTDTYANEPAAGNDGDLFLPSNGFHLERDTGAAWVPWGPIFPMTKPPALSTWAWINQGTATADETNGGIY